jgi:arylsulfatase A-like enzyme
MPPNLILVTCDQLRAFEMGCHGHPVVRTPHLDALAAGGVRFEQCLSNNPVCTPARSCLLTGQYSRTATGMLGNVHENPPDHQRTRLVAPTLPEVLRQHGYHTALIGKWHMAIRPEVVGFDQARYPLVTHYNYGQVYFDETGAHRKIAGFTGTFEADWVDQFLAQDHPQPFYLNYNLSLPHQPIGPRQLPPPYPTLFSRDQVHLRGNTRPATGKMDDAFWFKVYRGDDYYWDWLQKLPERPEDRLPPDFDLRDLHALYYGAIACVDDAVGRLMATLRRLKLAENTVVCFVSDHGDNLGSLGLYNKGTPNEESTRVPLIFSGHGISPGVDRRHLAQLLDVMPTLLDQVGLPVPPTVQGRSLVPALRQPDSEDLPAGDVVIETPSGWLALRTPSHLYAIGYDAAQRQLKAQPEWLFDLSADPLQMCNLAASVTHASLRHELRARLAAWNAATPWLAAPPYLTHAPWSARELRPVGERGTC